MNDFINIFCYLSTLLIIGTILKRYIKIFQTFFIPASIIGGVIGLIISENLLGKYYQIIPKNWEVLIKGIPGILIIPIIISIPLGMKLGQKKKAFKGAINMGGILFLVTFLQLFIGYLVHLILKNVLKIDLYKGFGSELNAGFAGGHGTAGVVSRTLKDIGSSYWELAQGVTVTLATIGLIFGIIFGIYQIKRKNKNLFSLDILKKYKNGYIENKNEQDSLGKETMLSTTIDTLAYHLAIIMGVCGFSIFTLNILKKYNVPLVSKLTVWSYGMIVMFIVWKIMIKKNLEWSIDSKVRSKITATLTEYAIVSAIASIPISGVLNYIIPILVVGIVGFVFTWIIILVLTKRYFKDYAFERALAIFGTSTGVFITGLLLLRICDPKFETPVLQDYSLGFSLTALLGPLLIALCIELSYYYAVFYPILILLSLIIVTILFLEYYNKEKRVGI